MNGNNSEFDTAETTREITRVVEKSIDSANKLGEFIGPIVAGSLKQGMGIIEDRLRYMRLERRARMMQRTQDLWREVGLNGPTRSIPLKLAIPLLEAAFVEDNDYLQDIWAQLLANATNSDNDMILQRAYISILEQLTQLDAIIVKEIYTLPYDNRQHCGVITKWLPNRARVYPLEESDRAEGFMEPPVKIKHSLANLARLGCIAISKTIAGEEKFGLIHTRLLGRDFVKACTVNTPKNRFEKENVIRDTK